MKTTAWGVGASQLMILVVSLTKDIRVIERRSLWMWRATILLNVVNRCRPKLVVFCTIAVENWVVIPFGTGYRILEPAPGTRFWLQITTGNTDVVWLCCTGRWLSCGRAVVRRLRRLSGSTRWTLTWRRVTRRRVCRPASSRRTMTAATTHHDTLLNPYVMSLIVCTLRLFLPHDAMHSADYAVAGCPFLRLSHSVETAKCIIRLFHFFFISCACREP